MLSQQRSFLPGSGSLSLYTSRPQSYRSGYQSHYGSRSARPAFAPVPTQSVAPSTTVTVQVQPVAERPVVTSVPVLA